MSRSKESRWLRPVVVLGLLMTLGLTACGDKEDGSSPVTSTRPAAAAPATTRTTYETTTTTISPYKKSQLSCDALVRNLGGIPSGVKKYGLHDGTLTWSPSHELAGLEGYDQITVGYSKVSGTESKELPTNAACSVVLTFRDTTPGGKLGLRYNLFTDEVGVHRQIEQSAVADGMETWAAVGEPELYALNGTYGEISGLEEPMRLVAAVDKLLGTDLKNETIADHLAEQKAYEDSFGSRAGK